MTEEPIGSKLVPSPLDGYVRAEPDEPVFTLQGGDPFAAPLVILWARLARARCDVGFEPEATMLWLNKVIAENQITRQSDRENLLYRATEAEGVSWAMSDYIKGYTALEPVEDKPKTAEMLSLFDYRVRAAGKISEAASELHEMFEKFVELKFDPAVLKHIRDEIVALRKLFNLVEPRPGRKIENVNRW